MIINQNNYWLKRIFVVCFLCFLFPSHLISAQTISTGKLYNNIFNLVSSYSFNDILDENEEHEYNSHTQIKEQNHADRRGVNSVFPLAINLETNSPYGPGGWPFLFLGTLLFSILVATWYYHQLTYIERNSGEFQNRMDEINRLKLQFFTTINHDLKLPLTLLLHPLEDILTTYRGDAIVESKLKFIERNIKHLIGVVNQFTEYRELETNKSKSFKKEETTNFSVLEPFVDSNLNEKFENSSGKEDITILIADNDTNSRLLIKDSLYSKYNILEADHGKEALSIAFKQIPDIIISEVMMTEMTGIELCYQLKANIRTNHIPFILISTSDSAEDHIKGLQSGADSYIFKPFEMNLLKVKVDKLIESRRLMKKYLHIQEHFNIDKADFNSEGNEFLDRIMKLMNQHMSNELYDVNLLVSDMNTSRSTFYRKLKELTGQAPNDFIQMIRLNRAAQLLSKNQNTISEVSYMVGFRDPNYFGKCFRKMYGEAPSHYVEKHKVKSDEILKTLNISNN